jgi:hypothetical protein
MTDRKHIERIKHMRCRVCIRLGQPADEASDAHHIREGVGGAERQHDYLAIPLCKEHHQGNSGIHSGNPWPFRLLKVDDLDLLADTIKELTRTS